MTKPQAGIFAAVLWTASLASAASMPPLTWTECVQLAAQQNPDLHASLLALQSSQADYRGSYNGILPQVGLTNSYRESETAGVNSGGSWSAQMSASLNLIDTAEWASIQSSLASFHQSQATYQLEATNTLRALYRAYSGLLYAQDAIQVNEAIRDTWKMNAQMVQLRYQSGRESKGNAMNTEAQRLQAEANVEQARRNVLAARTQLRQALGEDTYRVQAVTGTWTGADASTTPPDFDALVARLPQVLVQNAVVEQARAKVRQAQSTLWPSLGLTYAKGTTGSTEFPQNPFWTFTGTLSYPIFGGGPTATYFANQSANRSLQKAQEDMRSVKYQARLDLENAWTALMEAQDQVRIQQAFLAATQQRKSESDVRYQSGLMSFEDWIRVVADYASFQINFLRAQQSRLLAEAEWRYAQGESI